MFVRPLVTIPPSLSTKYSGFFFDDYDVVMNLSTVLLDALTLLWKAFLLLLKTGIRTGQWLFVFAKDAHSKRTFFFFRFVIPPIVMDI